MEATETQVEAVETVTEAAPSSVLSHAKQFDPSALREDRTEANEAGPEGETAEERTERLHHSAQQRRDANGQFDEGKKRVRPSKDAAVRIQKAHEKVETVTQQNSKLEQTVASLQAEVERLKRAQAPSSQIAKAEDRLDEADPEPLEDDPQFGGDYTKFLRAQAAHEARKVLREERARETQSRQEREVKETEAEISRGFTARVDEARKKYQDFDAVAFGPVLWLNPKTGKALPGGEAIDDFIMQDDNGAEVLYYLRQQDHAHEVDELMRLPVLKQYKRLSLLSQQLSSESSEKAGASGAVVTRPVKLPPKPPTPLRTEAQRPIEATPTDGSLGIRAHAKKWQPR